MKRLLPGVVAVLALVAPTAATELATTTYRLPQTTISTAGGRLSTPTYIVDTAAGQECAIGIATSTSYIIQSGFLNSQSTNPVPVELLSFEIVEDASTDEEIRDNEGEAQ